jgi:hypothetical protein
MATDLASLNPSRRRLLLAGAAVAATLVSSQVAIGSAQFATSILTTPRPSADEALFALLAEWAVLSKRQDAAFREVDAASDRCDALAPTVPKVADGDARLGLTGLNVGEPFDEVGVGGLKRIIELNGLPWDSGDGSFAKAYRTRLMGIVEEWQAYLAADDTARKASGLEAAECEAERVGVAIMRLFNRIARTPAQTAAGALGKIAVVSDYYNDAVTGDESTADDVLHSAVCDVNRLGLGRLTAEAQLVGAAAEA